jgi:hypothetical protein
MVRGEINLVAFYRGARLQPAASRFLLASVPKGDKVAWSGQMPLRSLKGLPHLASISSSKHQ